MPQLEIQPPQRRACDRLRAASAPPRVRRATRKWIGFGGWLAALVCATAGGCMAQQPTPQPETPQLLNQAFKSTMTCDEFKALLRAGDKHTAGTAILWLDGIYSARSGVNDFPQGWGRTLSQGVGGICAITVNASRPVIDIIGMIHRDYGG